MKVLYSITLVIFFLSACNPYRPIQKQEGGKNLAQMIKEGWYRNPETDLIDLSTPAAETKVDLVREMKLNRTWHKGHTPKQIERIFGTPHLKLENEFLYFTRKGCFKGYSKEWCAYIYFRFDPETGKSTQWGMNYN